MKNNLILFPTAYQSSEKEAEQLTPNDELKALRAAFDQALVDWPLEPAELPENNKMYCSSKK